LTETAPWLLGAKKGTVTYKDEADRYRHQAIGWVTLPGVEIRCGRGNADVPRDMESVGEIVIFGDHVMDGYFRSRKRRRQ